ncbi:MAG: OmpH family outer membrane protein [Gemmatimonadaceae bacterium]
MSYRLSAAALSLALVALPFGLNAQATGATASAPPGPVKLAFIDSRVVIDRAPGRAAAESTFQKEYDAARQQIQKMQDTLQAMIAAYQKQQATLTAVNKELREKEIQDKQNLFETRANILDQQMQRRQQDLVQPIMAQVREVLDAIRGEDNYTFIFDVGAQAATIVAADKGLDITEKVIARLKPIPVTAMKSDSTKTPLGAKPSPSGVTKPIKPSA